MERLTEQEFVERVQGILERYITNDQPLTKDDAKRLARELFSIGSLTKPEQKRGHHQTVRIHKDQGVWVPVTVFFETHEEGSIDKIRIHSRAFIEEYTANSF